MYYGTVIPQKRWTPTSEVAFRPSNPVPLIGIPQLPVFFVNRSGCLGFRLPDILRGCDRDLRNADDPVPLGRNRGRNAPMYIATRTHIRIGVSLSAVGNHYLTRSAKQSVVARLYAFEAQDTHP